MPTVLELIKAAHAEGEPLFKGDLPGHEFRGNQYAVAAQAAGEASDRAKRTARIRDHVQAGRLQWRASRLAPTRSQTDEHAKAARHHDLEANRQGALP